MVTENWINHLLFLFPSSNLCLFVFLLHSFPFFHPLTKDLSSAHQFTRPSRSSRPTSLHLYMPASLHLSRNCPCSVELLGSGAWSSHHHGLDYPLHISRGSFTGTVGIRLCISALWRIATMNSEGQTSSRTVEQEAERWDWLIKMLLLFLCKHQFFFVCFLLTRGHFNALTHSCSIRYNISICPPLWHKCLVNCSQQFSQVLQDHRNLSTFTFSRYGNYSCNIYCLCLSHPPKKISLDLIILL